MSEKARRRTIPESHVIEEQRDTAPARAWAGHVRIIADEGTVTVPGTWHLDLPQVSRVRRATERHAQPLPDRADLGAWHAHLVQLVTLRMPGMQLRVRRVKDSRWSELEFAASTVPPSVVCIDRAGLQQLLGPSARVELRIDDADR